jgi:hypothetical protein
LSTSRPKIRLLKVDTEDAVIHPDDLSFSMALFAVATILDVMRTPRERRGDDR